MKEVSHKRHIAKAITWRCIGTLDTILLSWFITGDPFMGLQIGLAEVLTKMLLYYFHERLWIRINLGKQVISQWRHILKTISWRVVGTLDTMLLAWLISGNPVVGLQVGMVEVVTKMLLYYLHERVWYKVDYGIKDRSTKEHVLAQDNLLPQEYSVSQKYRSQLKRHQPLVVWFSGLSGSGKSTLANLVEKKLAEKGIHTYSLDGDNIRTGLNKDLVFTSEERSENIRRIAEVAKLFIDSGTVVIAAFITPLKSDREIIKQIVGERFVGIFVKTSLQECERRDVKGLYKKARSGEIKNFTGIDAPYEEPVDFDITIDTENCTAQEAVEQIICVVERRIVSRK
ncbi:adenylyl-sulfate kinase [Salegentibacter sp. F188]|uniref:Adenylyl-sulfate kinase n=1 Tax=Autumnicola patrickiae TaxID=3075591 RepID=A0ABU3E498_9FLAO|nr:adenylyl-sulfate kinase [Salegentibacter sp. F188]MDT0690796.1 adenylyl-sulfate kinase [Salegentibacter sp. F188]